MYTGERLNRVGRIGPCGVEEVVGNNAIRCPVIVGKDLITKAITKIQVLPRNGSASVSSTREDIFGLL